MLDQKKEAAMWRRAFGLGVGVMVVCCVGALLTGETAAAALSWILGVWCWWNRERLERVDT